MRNARQDKPTKVFSKEKGQFVDNSAWIYTLFIYYFNYINLYITYSLARYRKLEGVVYNLNSTKQPFYFLRGSLLFRLFSRFISLRLVKEFRSFSFRYMIPRFNLPRATNRTIWSVLESSNVT